MNTLWLIFMIAMGACVGSFLNVVIYRLPRGESIVFPGSHCPSCGWAIMWYDNIPLFSWFILGGRCRRCKCAISPRYAIVEAGTAIRVAGLFAWYYIYHLRNLPGGSRGPGQFIDTWPMFAAHAALLCGLLACAVVDREYFQIPLEVMWVCAVIGLLAAAGDEGHRFFPTVSPSSIAAAIGAGVGLVISLILQSRGFIQTSFIDAERVPASQQTPSEPSQSEVPAPISSDFAPLPLASSQAEESPPTETHPEASTPASSQSASSPPADMQTEIPPLASSQTLETTQAAVQTPSHEETISSPPSHSPHSKERYESRTEPSPLGPRTILQIVVGAVTTALFAYVPGEGAEPEDGRNVAYGEPHGVRPRREMLWEVAFLLPPIILAFGATLLLRYVPAADRAWDRLFNAAIHPDLAPRLLSVGSAIFGFFVGGLLVWATRILGTLAFNKEAMGMGDVHMLAAIGAVTGWIVPTLTFFAAPFIGLGWALYVWLGRKQGVIPYGPHLAAACLVVMLFYDRIYARLAILLTGGQ